MIVQTDISRRTALISLILWATYFSATSISGGWIRILRLPLHSGCHWHRDCRDASARERVTRSTTSNYGIETCLVVINQLPFVRSRLNLRYVLVFLISTFDHLESKWVYKWGGRVDVVVKLNLYVPSSIVCAHGFTLISNLLLFKATPLMTIKKTTSSVKKHLTPKKIEKVSVRLRRDGGLLWATPPTRHTRAFGYASARETLLRESPLQARVSFYF